MQPVRKSLLPASCGHERCLWLGRLYESAQAATRGPRLRQIITDRSPDSGENPETHPQKCLKFRQKPRNSKPAAEASVRCRGPSSPSCLLSPQPPSKLQRWKAWPLSKSLHEASQTTCLQLLRSRSEQQRREHRFQYVTTPYKTTYYSRYNIQYGSYSIRSYMSSHMIKYNIIFQSSHRTAHHVAFSVV